VAIPLEVDERVAAAHYHVADVELVADEGRVGSLHEQVVGDRAVDRSHVLGLVMEREPDAGAPGGRARGVEAVSPLPPVVERARRVRGEGWHDQEFVPEPVRDGDRKSTRLNSSHDQISYAVFCLKKKTNNRKT